MRGATVAILGRVDHDMSHESILDPSPRCYACRATSVALDVAEDLPWSGDVIDDGENQEDHSALLE